MPLKTTISAEISHAISSKITQQINKQQSININADVVRNVGIYKGGDTDTISVRTTTNTIYADLTESIKLKIDNAVPLNLETFPKAQVETPQLRRNSRIYVDNNGLSTYMSIEDIKDLNTKILSVEDIADVDFDRIKTDDFVYIKNKQGR